MTENKKLSILDLIIILLERKWVFVIGMTAIIASSMIITMLLPKYYMAKAVVIPKVTSMPAGLGALMGDMPLGGLLESFDIFGGSDIDQFLAILESRRLADSVISEFDLVTRYKFKEKKKFFIEDVYKAYFKNLRTEETDLGNIEVAFIDTNPAFAAAVTNFIINQLDTISYDVARSNARNSREFFEDRLSHVKSAMDSAHSRLADFQIKHNYLDLENQVAASIEALSQIEAQIMTSDIQIELLQSRFGGNSKQIEEIKQDKQALKRQLEKYLSNGNGQLLISLKQAPVLGIQYAYLLRDVKVQEVLYAFVLQMFEQAKFNEMNNTAVISALEYANVPQKKLRPKRMIMVALATFCGFCLLAIGVLSEKWYYTERNAQSETYHKIKRVFSLLTK